MRCQFCSAPMPTQGFICEFCRKRNSLNMSSLPKVEIVDEDDKYNCPVCENELENINIGTKKKVLIQHCSHCDGVFIKENIMKQIIDKQTIDRQKFDHLMVRFIQNNPRHASTIKDKYKKCPICEKMMLRYNYGTAIGTASGVILDRCPEQHGIWLDSGELKQIIEWKYYGGALKNTSTIDNINLKDKSDENTKKIYNNYAIKGAIQQQRKYKMLKDNNSSDGSIFDIVRDIANSFMK